MNYLFTSESVSEGHPDKVADQISDALLDALLTNNDNPRGAFETFVTSNFVLVGGEYTFNKYELTNPVVKNIIRDVVRSIGYIDPALKFSVNEIEIENRIHSQSSEIHKAALEGAGDQGIMFGYACDETDAFMPFSAQLSHRLLETLAAIRKNGNEMPYLRPDAKSQVTVSYSESHQLEKIDTIVLSTQHNESVTQQEIEHDIKQILLPKVREQLTDKENALFDDSIKWHINPSGSFILGGPAGDTGLTGRKIIVDTYGGHAPHGGGAFSGKDATKVDRSASYMARHVAKNLVANKLATKCTIQLAYAIGVASPVSIFVDTHGTSKKSSAELVQLIREKFPLSVGDIIDYLDLFHVKYAPTAAYGHFGRIPTENTFSWEKIVSF
jgi:S-adenosylmethionine synthetase